MCTLLICHRVWPGTPLLVFGNRDESKARATAPLSEWTDGIVGGRDLEAGGTWLAVDAKGRGGALTNVRGGPESGSRSRGELIPMFLRDTGSAFDFAVQAWQSRYEFGGFNLVLWDTEHVVHCGTWGSPVRLPPGVFGVSNGTLDTPWPKILALKDKVRNLAQAPSASDAMEWLANRDASAEHTLPFTGVPDTVEASLSALFVEMPGYGTRSSAWLRLADADISFVERTFNDLSYTDRRIDLPR